MIRIECCDNLQFMQSLDSESIDLIYCDILYGTGRNFGDFKDLKPIRSEIEAHYLPRLKEMHRLLKPTGSIYLQMDWHIDHWIRCMMDDIFNYMNFENQIIWAFENPSGYKSIANKFVRGHDIILIYCKNKKIRKHNKQYSPYKYGYKPTSKNSKGIAISTVWTDIHSMQSQAVNAQSVGYSTQKPEKLLYRIIEASSDKGDTVADFYMGSGTTAVVCKKLKRKFIGCDINPKAIEITKNRLSKFPTPLL